MLRKNLCLAASLMLILIATLFTSCGGADANDSTNPESVSPGEALERANEIQQDAEDKQQEVEEEVRKVEEGY